MGRFPLSGGTLASGAKLASRPVATRAPSAAPVVASPSPLTLRTLTPPSTVWSSEADLARSFDSGLRVDWVPSRLSPSVSRPRLPLHFQGVRAGGTAQTTRQHVRPWPTDTLRLHRTRWATATSPPSRAFWALRIPGADRPAGGRGLICTPWPTLSAVRLG